MQTHCGLRKADDGDPRLAPLSRVDDASHSWQLGRPPSTAGAQVAMDGFLTLVVAPPTLAISSTNTWE
jgi:hypothetical protein